MSLISHRADSKTVQAIISFIPKRYPKGCSIFVSQDDPIGIIRFPLALLRQARA